MHYYEVAPNRIVRTDSASFTYSHSDKISVGQLVRIEVGKKQLTGVVISEVNKPDYKTKEISSVIENQPLPKQLVDLAKWMTDYYASPLANTLQTILPSGLHKNRREKEFIINTPKRKRTNFLLNKDQSKVIQEVTNKLGSFILQGVTGSGKTQVYIELAKRSLDSGRSAIILVPEIALTPQLISEFSNYFKNIVITHSHMTESQRHCAWKKALNSKDPIVAIGPRSALFTPLNNIGLIVVDEAHEPSYKQEQTPKYSALRVASVLGKLHKSLVVFGSATPSVSDRYLAEKSGGQVLKLEKVAIENTTPPQVVLIEMTKKENFKKHKFLSDELIDSISIAIARNKQALVFHNRRGSASTTLCGNCGWMAECPNCHLPMSLHADQHILKCHICSYKTKVPTNCPQCGEVDIIHKGIGTKLIESELKKIFPNKNIYRFDSDSSHSMEESYQDIYSGRIDIIIGTQVIAKGLDLPKLRVVGVVQADAGLALPDYGSSERTFQLLSQVIGRVGRNKHKTKVIVQTFQPSHPAIVYGLRQDYEAFYNHTLQERKSTLFPPFVYLLKLNCVYKTESAAIKNSKDFADQLRTKYKGVVQILGPTPAFYEHTFNSYRWQIVIKSKKREILLDIASSIPQKYWQFELDPTSLL